LLIYTFLESEIIIDLTEQNYIYFIKNLNMFNN
jgi:hypothetical protein